MKKIALAVMVAAAGILAGCVVTSVYPFYTSKDLVFDQALVGEWSKSSPSDNERWKFEPDGDQAYKVTYTSDDKPSAMRGHLFKLEGQTFLDLFPEDVKDETLPPPIPSHMLLRVLEVTPTLRMAPLNFKWLSELLEKDPKALRHHLTPEGGKPDDRRLVLTADTQELQRFVIKHLKTEAAWEDAFELQRVKAKSAAAAGDAK